MPISFKWVESEEEPFVPTGVAIVKEMKPKAGESGFFPPAGPYVGVPPTATPAGITIPEELFPCVVDIETTGINPWDSRIVCIGAVDPAEPDDIKVFFDLDEAKVLRDFIDWFNSKAFNQIVGYNVGFDLRFIFAKCMQYRIQCGQFANADLFDIMQVMQQVKQKFVYGRQKPGRLDVWAQLLLGEKKLGTGEDVLKWFEKKKYSKIIKYSKKDVEIELKLYALILWTKELI